MQFNHLDVLQNDEIFSICPPSNCRWVNMKDGPVLRISNNRVVLSYVGFMLVPVGLGGAFYFIAKGIILYLILGFFGLILALLIYAIIWSLRYTWITFNAFTFKVGRGIFGPGRWRCMYLNKVMIRPAYEVEGQVGYQVVLDESKVELDALKKKDRESLLTDARKYFENWNLDLRNPLGEMVGQAMMRSAKAGREFSTESFLTSCSNDELLSVMILINRNQTVNIAMVRDIEQHRALRDYLNQLIQLHLRAMA